MSSDTTYSLREMPLSLASERERVSTMLAANGLRTEALDLYIGVFDQDDRLLGGGGLCGNVIKCIALDASLRGEAISNTLVSRLRTEARQRGHRNIFIYTKPENEPLFCSLAFHVIARSPKAVMLESDRRGISSYCAYLASLRRDNVDAAAIVMNCNPLTRGHLYLIEHAASQCGHLFIIPVMEDKSLFPYRMRLSMMRDACSRFDNVTVCDGSPYAVSAVTFPSYFLKCADDATDTSIQLDLDIFCRHIAPALGVATRYAGSEPTDALTARYNELMAEMLPKHGLRFREIPRLQADGVSISASRVREYLSNGRFAEALAMLAPTSVPYVMAHLATEALERELSLTPKPGLVDRTDNGAHTDMDFALMMRSIDALTPGLAAMANAANVADAVARGQEAEKAMFEATGGVNTHKGAIFCIGITLLSAMQLYRHGEEISVSALSATISRLAAEIADAPTQSHGSEARRRYKVGGALGNAYDGYRRLFESWLPYYKKHRDDRDAEYKTLLTIMTEIDDTNVLHRAGEEGAKWLKEQSADLLADFSIDRLQAFNTECTTRNISPGGAADMLSLTILIDSITTK